MAWPRWGRFDGFGERFGAKFGLIWWPKLVRAWPKMLRWWPQALRWWTRLRWRWCNCLGSEIDLRAPSRLMVDTITTVPKSKLGTHIGRMDDADLARLGLAVIVFLGRLYRHGRAGRRAERGADKGRRGLRRAGTQSLHPLVFGAPATSNTSPRRKPGFGRLLLPTWRHEN